MTTAARLRDSTQILLPGDTTARLRGDIDEQFVVTVRQENGRVRIIGSPTEIKRVSAFLARKGIAVD